MESLYFRILAQLWFYDKSILKGDYLLLTPCHKRLKYGFRVKSISEIMPGSL